MYVENVKEENIFSPDNVKLLLETGNKRRQVGETKMNEASSRSHAILTIVS